MWHEGISFSLPANLTLQSEVIDAEEENYLGETRYRPLTLGDPGGLAAQPDAVFERGIDGGYVHQGLIFGAQFFIEHVMDSPILTQRYTGETRDEWLELVGEDLFDEETAQFLRDKRDIVEDSPFATSFVDAMELNFDDDDDDGVELPEEGYLRVKDLLHEDEETRLANVSVSLVESSLNEDDLLHLTYDSSQTWARARWRGASPQTSPLTRSLPTTKGSQPPSGTPRSAGRSPRRNSQCHKSKRG